MAAPKKEEMTVIGGGKGKKGKKPKQQVKETSDVFKIDLEVIKKFGIVGCSPPIAPEDLDPKIKELEQRLVSLSKEGEQELAQIKKELSKNIDKAVEEDIEREQKAMEYELEDEKPDGGYFGQKFGVKK